MSRIITLVIILTIILPSIAFADGDNTPALGSANLKGEAAAYMEISGRCSISTATVRHSPCYQTHEEVLVFEGPQMLGYTSIDGSGNIIYTKWYAVTSLTPEENEWKAKWNKKIEGDDLTFNFFEDHSDSPSIIITAGSNEEPKRYTVISRDPQTEKTITSVFDIKCSEIFTDIYEYDGTLLISQTRRSGGRRDFIHRYGYGKDSRLEWSEMTDSEGRVTSLMEYGENFRLRRMEIYSYTGNDEPTLYSYKYTYKGTTDNYTYRMKMHRGTHPYYNDSTFTVENGRLLNMRTNIAYPSPKGKRRKFGDITSSALSLRYNPQGDYILSRDETNGIETYISYLYDTRGNWYSMTTRTTVWDTHAVKRLRSIIYKD